MAQARKAKYESTDAYCPVCASVAGEPCYQVRPQNGGTIKRVAMLRQVHDKRPGTVKNRAHASARGTRPGTPADASRMDQTRVRRATVPSQCPTCRRTIAVGSPIAEWDGQQQHPSCASFLQNQAAVLAAQTFAAQKPSEWR